MKSIRNLSICFTAIVAIMLLSAKPANAQVDFTWSGVCESSTQFTAIVPNPAIITSWHWDFGDGSIANIQNPTHTYIASGTYGVTLTVVNTSAVTSSVLHWVEINGIPVTDFAATSACFGDSTYFTMVGNYIQSINIFQWAFGDGTYASYNAPITPVHKYPVPGTFVVSLTVIDTNGCDFVVTRPVEVKQNPTAFFSYTTPSCSNTPVQFTDLSSAYSGYILKWIWNFGDGSPIDTITFPNSPNVTHQFPSLGTYIVTLTVINFPSLCSNSFSSPVTVNPAPVANFYFIELCEDQPVQFSDISQAAGSVTIIGLSWDFGDPASGVSNTSTIQNPIHLYSNPGTYSVMEIVTGSNSCKDTIIKTLSIHPHPPVDFTHTGGSVNSPVYFYPDPAVTNINAVVSYLWDFGDGVTSAASNTMHTYISPGNYTSTLTITDTLGCTNSIAHIINIVEGAVAHFTTSVPACDGSAVSFTDLSSVTSGYITSWHWTFGDGSDTTIVFPGNPNISHSYASAGTYTATLTIATSDGFTATESQSITIHQQPVADFTFTPSLCEGAIVHFTDQSLIAGTIVQWNWNFGDPATGASNVSSLQNPDHIFSTFGTYNVQLIVSTAFGCIDTISHSLVINPLLQVSFTYSGNCQNNAVVFTPIVNGATITSWLWQFGDGTSSILQYPTHIYTIAGTYNVSLTVTNDAGCTSIVTMILQIYPQPVAAFTYSQPACSGSSVIFTDLSQNTAGGTIVSWAWDFGDPVSGILNTSNLQNPSHVYTIAGAYSVMLIVTNTGGCVDTIVSNVVINFHPQAEFTFTAPQLNVPVQFTDLSTVTSAAITGWNWNFGDGNFSSDQNPTHTYTIPGTYIAQLSVTDANGCGNSTDSVLVIPGGVNSITITGKVYAGAEAINSATVRLIQLDNTGFPVAMTATTPNANNDYTFNNVPEGNYLLHAYPAAGSPFATNYLPTFYTSSIYWENATGLLLGTALNPYNIYMANYEIAGGGGFTINGQLVIGDKSISVAGQEILLLDNQNNPVGYAFTDANGNFSFTTLQAGTYAVNPVITGYTTYPYYVTLNENTSPAFVTFTITGLTITASKTNPEIKEGVQFFPNPANEVLNITFQEIIQALDVEVYSAKGDRQLVKRFSSGMNFKLNISSLPVGLYLIKLTYNNGMVKSCKIIKE